MGVTAVGGPNKLQRSDCVVVLACMTLISILVGCIAENSRQQAENVGCRENLRQWYGIFQGYLDENDGYLFRTPSTSGWYWTTSLKAEHKDWRRMGIWLCPRASTPATAEDGSQNNVPSVFAAWGIYHEPGYGPDGLAGSYGLNGYVVNISYGAVYEGRIPANEGWGNLHNVPSPQRVPMFIDALRFDLWPKATQGPALDEFAEWTANNMARCCINRHDGAVNCLFVDGSVRKVDLKELWTLKWHRSFDTAGPWTKAGGVQPEDWPEWMQFFKDY